MFGRSKPVVFDPYARRRSRRLLPRWLVLLLLGGALGAGSVVYVQEQLLPARLSAVDSAELQKSYEQAEAERARFETELGETRQRLEVTLSEKQALAGRLETTQRDAEALRQDVTALVDALPPDPRGGAVAVRAARFDLGDGGNLAYDVVLSRDKPNGKALAGVIQFVVAGASDSVTSEPKAISIGAYESVRGSLALPPGFKPRQATVQVLDRAGGKLLGMRVMYVR
jgi:hypothetical protein